MHVATASTARWVGYSDRVTALICQTSTTTTAARPTNNRTATIPTGRSSIGAVR